MGSYCRRSHSTSNLRECRVALPAVAQWLRRSVAEPAAAAVFSDRGENENARVFEISAPVNDPHGVKINPEPTSTASLIAVYRRCVKPHNQSNQYRVANG